MVVGNLGFRVRVKTGDGRRLPLLRASTHGGAGFPPTPESHNIAKTSPRRECSAVCSAPTPLLVVDGERETTEGNRAPHEAKQARKQASKHASKHAREHRPGEARRSQQTPGEARRGQ